MHADASARVEEAATHAEAVPDLARRALARWRRRGPAAPGLSRRTERRAPTDGAMTSDDRRRRRAERASRRRPSAASCRAPGGPAGDAGEGPRCRPRPRLPAVRRRPLAEAAGDPDARPDRHRHREPVLPPPRARRRGRRARVRATRSCCATAPRTPEREAAYLDLLVESARRRDDHRGATSRHGPPPTLAARLAGAARARQLPRARRRGARRCLATTARGGALAARAPPRPRPSGPGRRVG